MKSTHNYTFHEIKEIRGKKNAIPENLEIIEDLIEIHEIKELRNNSTNEPNKENLAQNNNCNNSDGKNQILCDHCQQQMNENEIENENIENDDDENKDDEFNILCDDCKGEFFENNEEEKIYDLIDVIFGKLNDDNILNDNELKKTYNELNEEKKNEIIEGIKIKIENKEQEERFNNFLNSL